MFRKPFIMDQLMEMMVIYANNLEVLVNERTQLLYEEKQKTEDLLHRMLPKSVSFTFTFDFSWKEDKQATNDWYFTGQWRNDWLEDLASNRNPMKPSRSILAISLVSRKCLQKAPRSRYVQIRRMCVGSLLTLLFRLIGGQLPQRLVYLVWLNHSGLRCVQSRNYRRCLHGGKYQSQFITLTHRVYYFEIDLYANRYQVCLYPMVIFMPVWLRQWRWTCSQRLRTIESLTDQKIRFYSGLAFILVIVASIIY